MFVWLNNNILDLKLVIMRGSPTNLFFIINYNQVDYYAVSIFIAFDSTKLIFIELLKGFFSSCENF